VNPIDILYSWQAILVACAATGLTQFTKVAIDLVRGYLHPSSGKTMADMAKMGRELRKGTSLANRLIDKLMLPALPILYGRACACIVPARPDAIIEYASSHQISGVGLYAIVAAWGAACGQFADYLFSRAKDAVELFAGSKTSRPADEDNSG